MLEVDKYIKEYLDYLEVEKNRSPKTVDNYKRYLDIFVKEEKLSSIKDIDFDSVKNFRLKLSRKEIDGQNLKKSTQSYYVISIRNFLKYLIKRNVKINILPEQIELPKMPQRQIEIVEYGDLERFLNTPDTKDLRGLRDKAILEILFSTGLRISELCSLSRYINLERGEMSVRGKGGKIRVVFLSKRATDALKNYLDKRGDAEENLFVSYSKAKNPKVIGKITPRAVQRLVKFYAKKAGIIGHLTPHQLRHQFATDLLMNGADIRSVQSLLGHSNIATTQVYTHITNKELKEIHKSFHGRRRNK